jgi:hypothetical protein
VKWLLPIAHCACCHHSGSFSASELTHDITRAGLSSNTRWYPAPDKAAFVIARAVYASGLSTPLRRAGAW